MDHPTDGVLRRLLDEPAGVADVDRQHVMSCQECLRRVTAFRDDAQLVHAALATEVRVDVDAAPAWQRLSAAASTTTTGRVRSAAPRAGRVRTALQRPAVATVAVAMVLSGAGAAAANDWLQIFRTKKVVPVSLSTADLNALPDLRE